MKELFIFCSIALVSTLIIIFLKNKLNDRKLRKINEIHKKANFLGKIGVQLILKIEFLKDKNPSLNKDWCMLCNWLDVDFDGINYSHQEALKKAYIAYLARGIAPSMRLQTSFLQFKKDFQNQNYEKNLPPEEIIKLFDRLFATSEEMISMKKYSYQTESNLLKKLLEFLKKYKLEIFISTAWVVVGCLIFYIFDPLNLDDSYYWEDKDYLKIIYILTMPLQWFVIKNIYLNYIKEN